MTICICAEFGFIDIKAVHYCRPPHFLTLIVRNVEWHGTRRRLESSDKFGYGVFKGETWVSVPPRDPEKSAPHSDLKSGNRSNTRRLQRSTYRLEGRLPLTQDTLSWNTWPCGFGMGAELPSCHSGVDGSLAAADAVSRGSHMAVTRQSPSVCHSAVHSRHRFDSWEI